MAVTSHQTVMPLVRGVCASRGSGGGGGAGGGGSAMTIGFKQC